MAKIFIETERLILREIVESDVERMFLLDSNPDVMKYIGVKPLTQLAESAETIKKIRKQYEENGIGRWAVIEKETELLIGWSGLKVLTEPLNGFVNVYELGYRFLPETWGKGYATEAAKAMLDHGFNQINLEIIYACAHEENDGSNHVLTKIGFQKTGEFLEPDGNCYWYELSKEHFRNN